MKQIKHDADFAAERRVQIYLMPETRQRVNAVKFAVNGAIDAERSAYPSDGKVSQDEIINFALDFVPDLADRIIHARRLEQGVA